MGDILGDEIPTKEKSEQDPENQANKLNFDETEENQIDEDENDEGNKIFNEQLKEIFKIYNNEIYTAINNILTVYPESIEVLSKEILFLENQLTGEDSEYLYNKSIATGKSSKKAYEIYHAVKLTLENVVKERDHYVKVLEYIKKREQKIQVSLLMNQVN